MKSPVTHPIRVLPLLRRMLLACLVATWLPALRLVAHPVAQGAIDLSLQPGKALLTVRVSEEEMLVSFAHSEAAETDPLAYHGRYLPRHLQVIQGSAPLVGTLVSATQTPGTALPAVYQYEYHPAGTTPLTLRQDVLREFDFAPGNPWEASYLVRIERAGAAAENGRLLTAREPLTVAWQPPSSESAGAASVFAAFFRHGWHHIMGGYDHLLFMCALVLAARGLWGLAKVVTVFTAAHTLTIILAVKGWVHVPAGIVEPMIAGSIVVAALITVIRPQRARESGQLALAFGFGLFHGLGFAGGLLEVLQAQPGTGVATAISGFALGVEAGHQAVALPLFSLLLLARRWTATTEARARLYRPSLRLASGMVSLAGMVYLAAALRASTR
ncbi:MAG TPA: HupE/UreJ family protein [Candidatus Limnocylindria bacterium]|nr:HupE/UreJ family protein [Candidatus Limnocylindria bacterium]